MLASIRWGWRKGGPIVIITTLKLGGCKEKTYLLGELALIRWGHSAGRRRSGTAVVKKKKKKEPTCLIGFNMLDRGGLIVSAIVRAEGAGGNQW